MKVVSVISKQAGCGQSTIAVNLASGLVRKGSRVLMINPAHNEKLPNWLGINLKQEQTAAADNAENGQSISSTKMGVDLMNCDSGPEGFSDVTVCLSFLEKLNYDFLIMQPASNKDCRLVSATNCSVIVCTDLSDANEVMKLQALEHSLRNSVGEASRIQLIVPNKVNAKEWEHNSREMFALGEYFGFEKIADPIPYCERIHDLYLRRRTVWDLSQQNLQAVFLRLVEAVANL